MSQLKVTQAKIQKQNLTTQRFMNYEVDEFNNVQNKMYKDALFGLTNYSKEQIKTMSFKEQNTITRIHKKTQSILNLWKQELCNNYVNELFKKLFPKSELTKELTEDFGSTIDPTFKNFLTFKQLGIDKKRIVYKLIEKDVLPKNFFELNETK